MDFTLLLKLVIIQITLITVVQTARLSLHTHTHIYIYIYVAVRGQSVPYIAGVDSSTVSVISCSLTNFYLP